MCRRNFLEGRVAFSHTRLSNNRSVMPLDVRGRTRATLVGSTGVPPFAGRRGQAVEPRPCLGSGAAIAPVNEEFQVGAGHHPASIKSLPFVHTARRYYRSDGLVRSSDRSPAQRAPRLRVAASLRAGAEKTNKLDYLEEVKVVTRFL